MRVNSISYFLLLLMSLLVIQSIGGYFQIRDYRRGDPGRHKRVGQIPSAHIFRRKGIERIQYI